MTSLVCLVNPRGPGIIGYVRALTSDATVQNLVPEWAPPSFDDIYGTMFISALLLSAVVLAISPKRPGFFQLGTFLAFGVLGLRTTRGVVWFGMVMAPILAAHIACLVDQYKRTSSQKKVRFGNPALNWLFAGVILFAALISLPWFKDSLPLPRVKAGLISSETPLDATDYLLSEQLPREIFNEIGFGSYLIWAAYPDYLVVADPRIELYSRDIWWDYTVLGNALPGWGNLLDRYGFNTLMLNPTTQTGLITAVEDSGRWVKEYEDQAVVIFVRYGQ